ncbi:MAG: monoamine oxidase [Solirubrobacteraceae bacterium]|nr:monoamine oxidase [Solirubrobacteraceae bacterium]
MAQQQRELDDAKLVPDWFHRSRFGFSWCLPPGMRVAVIGGGFAGMAAAWYLNACGVRVDVYEASDRVGGRVHTDHSFINGKFVEAGAELIGKNHPLWLRLANDFHLTMVPITEDDKYHEQGLSPRFIFGGRVLTWAERQRMESNLKTVYTAIGKEAKLIHPRRPWDSPGALDFDAKSIVDKLPELLAGVGGPGLGDVRSWLEFTIPNDNCAVLSRHSYLALLTLVSAGRMGSDDKDLHGYWYYTETDRCKEGNQALAEKIAASLPNVHTNAPVRSVTINPLYTRPVQITASPVFQGDYDFAVLTLPPSRWGSITFNPPFNAARRSVSHGPAVKFLASYPTQHWKAAGLAPSTKSDNIGSVWPSTDHQENPDNPQGPFGLTVYSGGPFALPEREYKPRLTDLYTYNGQKPTPIKTKFVDWPNIIAGYAVPAPREVMSIMRLLTEQPHLGRMYFAGEQTSSGFFGYMEGALQSGARAARDIVWGAAFACRRLIIQA